MEIRHNQAKDYKREKVLKMFSKPKFMAEISSKNKCLGKIVLTTLKFTRMNR